MSIIGQKKEFPERKIGENKNKIDLFLIIMQVGQTFCKWPRTC